MSNQVSITQSNQPNENTLCLYRFENNLYDSSQNRYTLNLSGSVGFTNDPTDPAVGSYRTNTFNNGFFALPPSMYNRFTNLTNYTIEFWANHLNFGSNQYVFTADDSFGLSIIFPDSPNGDIYIRQAQVNLGLKYSAGNIFGTWNHWAFVVSGTTSRQIWMNGVLKASDAGTGQFGTKPSIVKIGQFPNVSTTFNGYLDDFRITTKALSGPFPTRD